MRDKLGRFKKGHIPWCKLHPELMPRGKNHPKGMLGKTAWNKDTKGIMKPNSGSFKKGKHYSPKTEFKKGRKTWNKGLPPEKSPNYKGGKKISTFGYILILQPSHPNADHQGYIHRSHLVMEKILGRFLIPPEMVHHKGIKYPLDSIENKQDDRPENLRLFANSGKHSKFHHNFNKEVLRNK